MKIFELIGTCSMVELSNLSNNNKEFTISKKNIISFLELLKNNIKEHYNKNINLSSDEDSVFNETYEGIKIVLYNCVDEDIKTFLEAVGFKTLYSYLGNSTFSNISKKLKRKPVYVMLYTINKRDYVKDI